MWFRYNLGYSEHKVKITENSGTVVFDAFEYGSKSEIKNSEIEDIEGGWIEEEGTSSEEDSTSSVSVPKKKNGGKIPVPLAVGVCAAVLILVFPLFKRR